MIIKIIILSLAVALVSCKGNTAVDESSPASVFQSNNKEVVCFIYHRFGDKRHPTTNVSTKDFEDHLRYLTEKGYHIVTLSQAIDYLHSDEAEKKVAAITIDDAFKSFYENGLPLLKKYGVPATLFINTKTIGGSDYMNWSQLRESMNHRIEIGNHTHSHEYFLNEPSEERYKKFEQDIAFCQSLIKENLNVSPTVFAYPYGEFDEEMKRIVKKMGFKGAAAQNSGVAHAGTDLFQIPRFPMAEAYSELKKFSEKATMKALRVIRQVPANTLLPANEMKPLLELTIDMRGLKKNPVQCFVQGGECILKRIHEGENEMTITLQFSDNLSHRRRTLYTITMQDENGNWRWYSHLWINPNVKL